MTIAFVILGLAILAGASVFVILVAIQVFFAIMGELERNGWE